MILLSTVDLLNLERVIIGVFVLSVVTLAVLFFLHLCQSVTLAQTSIAATVCDSSTFAGSMCIGSTCVISPARTSQCIKNLDPSLSTYTIHFCTTDSTTGQHVVVVQTFTDSACSNLMATSVVAPSECNGGKSYSCVAFTDAFPALPTTSSYRLCSGTSCNFNCQTVYIQANQCISPKSSTSVLLQCSSVDSTSTLKGFNSASCATGSEAQILGPYNSGDCVVSGQSSVRLTCPPISSTNGSGVTPPSSSSPSSSSPSSSYPSATQTNNSDSSSSDPTRAQIISLVCACVIGFASIVSLTTIHCWSSPCCSLDAPATKSGHMPVACEYPSVVHALRLAVVGLIITAFIVNSWSLFQLNSSTLVQATITEFHFEGIVSFWQNQPYSSCDQTWGCILLQVGSWVTIATSSLAGLYAFCGWGVILYSEFDSNRSSKPSHVAYQFHLLAAVALSASTCAWALIMHEYWMASLNDESSQLSLQFDVSWYLLLAATCLQLILCYATRSQWKYSAYQYRRTQQERVTVQFDSRLNSGNNITRRTQYSAHSVPVLLFRKPVESLGAPNASSQQQLSQSDGNRTTRQALLARIEQRTQQELVETQAHCHVIRTTPVDKASMTAPQTSVQESDVRVHLGEAKSETNVELQPIAKPVLPSESGPESVPSALKPAQDAVSSEIVNQVIVTVPLSPNEAPAISTEADTNNNNHSENLNTPQVLPLNRTSFPLIPVPEADPSSIEIPASAESLLNSPSGAQDSNFEPSAVTIDPKSEILTPLERGRRQAALFVQWRQLAAKLGLQSAGEAEAFAKQYKYSDQQVREILDS